MPRPSHVPAYRLHKASGQARAIVAGHHVYLGPYGSEESRNNYARLLADHFAAVTSSPPAPASNGAGDPPRLLVNELLVRYLQFADNYYTKNGRPTGEADNVRAAVRPLRALYGDSFCDEFGPRSLKRVQQYMIDVEDLARSVINNRTNTIKRVFRWGVSEELLPARVDQALRTVAGLRYGRCNARESEPVRPVPDEWVAATVKALPPILADMVLLQRLTGMRPGSLVIMRPCDIDRSGDVWVYEPSDHKTKHHEKKLLVFLGPQSKAIVGKYMNRSPSAYLFSPQEVQQWREQQRTLQVRYPSELRRSQRLKELRRRRARKRPPGQCYDSYSFRRAIQYGIAKACKAGAEIAAWHPNQLRHSRGAEVRKRYGLVGAQLVLGHAKADVTQVYAERDLDLARTDANARGWFLKSGRDQTRPAASPIRNLPDSQPTVDAIDWSYARRLHEKQLAGEPLTDAEKAFMEQARHARDRMAAANSTTRRAADNVASGDPPAGAQASAGLVPLDQMKAGDRYKGEDGGLYGGGDNQPPAQHLKAALAEAAKIVPLDPAGKPSFEGKIVLISIPMSNTAMEFMMFKRQADADPHKSPRIVIVNGAQGGKDAAQWSEKAGEDVWNSLDKTLGAEGVTPQQVQVAWLKQGMRNPFSHGAFPKHAQDLKDQIASALVIAHKRYPNLRIAYLSSRIYGGWAAGIYPEPYAYESSFAVRWLILQQMAGDPALSFDPAKSKTPVPLLLWGPYLWADGTTPRKSDGLAWNKSDFAKDWLHPSQEGASKVGSLLMRFFMTDATAKDWFTATGKRQATSRTADNQVSNIRAFCRNGQTFITWKDAIEGEADAKLRYAIYRSDRPITQEDLAQAQLLQKDILYNSARLFGYGFSEKGRLDPAKPMVVLEEGGGPLPMWSGVTAVTVKKADSSHYAVVATDLDGNIVGKVIPGRNATAEAIDEVVAPPTPIRYKSATTKPGSIAFAKGQPLFVELHASNGYPTDKEYRPNGDNYLYFAKPEMGYRDGLQGTFQVRESRTPNSSNLMLHSIEAIENPSASPINLTKETFWFGYLCVPQWAREKEPRAYPFTERRMLWIIDWVTKTYDVDRERTYAGGGSMGAWGSTTFAFRHPEIFAAVYPNRPRTRQRGLPSLAKLPAGQTEALMDDGKTPYLERQDMVKFATEHHEDLPVYIWCCGRQDGFATWKEQIDMVKATTASHHGFAFAWNDGDHSSGSAPMSRLMKRYGPEKFARNQSYPAFGNSSLNDDLGSGELGENKKVKDGAAEGGINLGFIWTDLVDEENRWSVKLSNDLAKAEMTVDVTPRRCQRFRPKPGEKLKWANSAGGAGEIAADQWGQVTIEKVKILPRAETALTISR